MTHPAEGLTLRFWNTMQTSMQGDNMTICSLNVRGLSNDKKRRETFLWLKKKQFSICCPQETHSTNESRIYWPSQWGYSTIFTEFSSSKADVGILFNNNFQFNILKCCTDPEGRFIIVDVETEEKISTLVNIYAPNRDDPIFLEGSVEKCYISNVTVPI